MKKVSPYIKNGLIGGSIGFSLFVLLILAGNVHIIDTYSNILDYIFDFLVILISPFLLLNLCEELECIFFMPFFALIEGFIVGLIFTKIKQKTIKTAIRKLC